MVRLCFGGPTLKYFVTWQCDDCDTGMAFLTVIPSDDELPLDAIMREAFNAEDVAPGTSFTVFSILRAEAAQVIV